MRLGGRGYGSGPGLVCALEGTDCPLAARNRTAHVDNKIDSTFDHMIPWGLGRRQSVLITLVGVRM